ncbi:MAG TPA: extracellular solute-binding protein [Stellaceae bacterium]|jgi:ABC-type Fe3+ transport system substrate-binding protein|nr:extracellular solute-binding protein [Stellaceae bacterium]
MTRRQQRIAALGFLAVIAAGAGATSAFADDWQAGAPPAWQKIFDDARKEGHVAVVGPSELAVPIAEAFLKDTGIQVDFLGGVASVNASRVAREVRAGNVTIDFMYTGTAELPLVKEGLFADEKARLLLPGTADPKNWTDGKLTWVDNTQQYMLRTQATVQSIPFYDSNAVKPPPTSWKQLLEPRFKGKIVAYDPRAGGPGQQMVGYIGAQLGIEFLKELYVGQQVIYSQDSRQMSEWITRGVYMVGLGVLLPDYVTLHEAGITNLAPAAFTDGPGTLSGGFSVLIMPKGAPHPNAQTVFLNWAASQRGQEVYSHVEHQLSRRVDVHDPAVLPFTVPQPGVTYLDQYNEDWALNQRAKIIDAVLEALGGR